MAYHVREADREIGPYLCIHKAFAAARLLALKGLGCSVLRDDGITIGVFGRGAGIMAALYRAQRANRELLATRSAIRPGDCDREVA
jgi:hypothetical protein